MALNGGQLLALYIYIYFRSLKVVLFMYWAHKANKGFSWDIPGEALTAYVFTWAIVKDL